MRGFQGDQVIFQQSPSPEKKQPHIHVNKQTQTQREKFHNGTYAKVPQGGEKEKEPCLQVRTNFTTITNNLQLYPKIHTDL